MTGLSPKSALLFSAIFYIALLIILFPYYQYQMDPDGISYIGIAQKYLRGDFANAINGCWGPMISWLLVPFLAVGFKPLIGFKLLTGIIGFLALIQCYRLFQKFDIHPNFYLPSFLITAILSLSFALTLVAPDLLFAFFGICFLNQLLNYYENQKRSTVIWMGIIGALLFLTKNYGLPFFMVTFSLICLAILLRKSMNDQRLKLVGHYIIGMLFFGGISFVWIYLLSNKYDYWTFGNAGSYNHKVFGPHSLGHPMFYAGLLAPSNPTATTVMEDFSYITVPEWPELDWKSIANFYIKRFRINFFAFLRLLGEFSYVGIASLLASCVLLVNLGKKAIYNKLLVILIFLFVLSAGYLILLIEHRYLWLYDFILVLLGSYFLTLIFKSFQLSRLSKIAIILLFYGSFLLYPFSILVRNFNFNADLHTQNQQIQHLDLKGKIATKGTWYGGAMLAYYNNCQFYGPCKNTSPELVQKELEAVGIDYLIVWKNAYQEEDDLFFEKVDVGVGDFVVYRVR